MYMFHLVWDLNYHVWLAGLHFLWLGCIFCCCAYFGDLNLDLNIFASFLLILLCKLVLRFSHFLLRPREFFFFTYVLVFLQVMKLLCVYTRSMMLQSDLAYKIMELLFSLPKFRSFLQDMCCLLWRVVGWENLTLFG